MFGLKSKERTVGLTAELSEIKLTESRIFFCLETKHRTNDLRRFFRTLKGRGDDTCNPVFLEFRDTCFDLCTPTVGESIGCLWVRTHDSFDVIFCLTMPHHEIFVA